MAHDGAHLRRIRPADLDESTAQTPGMRRLAAISAGTCGAQRLFMGVTHLGPGLCSGAHHHGESETAIYVVAGRPVFSFREGDSIVRLECEPGDYVYVPPFVPHVEENPSTTEEAVVVLARSTQESIVVNLGEL